MKQTLIYTFIMLVSLVKGQDSTSINKESDMFSFDLIYGHCLLKNSFNPKINNYTNFKLNNPIQTIGLSLSGAYVREKRHIYAIHMSYSQVIPQEIMINESIKSKINGYIFGINMLGLDLFSKSKIANCIVGVGFNTGRLRISSENYIQQKNPFFSPTISIQPKLIIGPLALSIRADYGFDISKKNWRSVNLTTKNNALNLNPSKITGAILYLSIGWVLK